jgi:hypothetical protein
MRQRDVSAWRLTQSLRDAILAAVLQTASLQRLRDVTDLIARHLCERPRRRNSQTTLIRRSARP